MKNLHVAIASALFASLLYAADLTGRWVATTQSPDGEKRETIFALKSEGDRLTGYISSPQGDTAISEGKVNGDEVSFAVVREALGQERKVVYTGKVTAD